MQAEVDGYFAKLNSWGQWGHDDRRGTLNLITPQKRQTAMQRCLSSTAQAWVEHVPQDIAQDIAHRPPWADHPLERVHNMVKGVLDICRPCVRGSY